MAELGKENVKLLMHWDIKPEREQDYFEFVVREWVPGITRLGIEPTGAWYTAYSHDRQSQIMTEGVAEDLDTMRRILKSKDWVRLHERLLEYVSNDKQKVVRVTGDFQL
ncbi:MAG: hypothetical protein HKUEN02_12750 [Anaerolineaceae bacterium]|nr:MAG: hypothetical protein HKUEN02_12750 [Anaerolineaceae bacterium]